MAGSERTPAAAAALLAVLLLAGGLACASTTAATKDVDAAPQSVQEPVSPPSEVPQAPAEAEEMPAPADAEEPAPAGTTADGGLAEPAEDPAETDAPAPKATDVVVISEGKAPDRDDVSLYEASRRARRERGEEPAGSAGALVITNQTLEDQTPPGRISFGTTERKIATGPPPAASEPAEGPQAGTDAAPDDAEAAPGAVGEGGEEDAEVAEEAVAAEPPLEERNPELYWRSRVREARLRWREAVARVEELQGLAGQLRYDFYATDDPWLRDSSIKPAWDRTLVDLEESRQEVDFQRRTVEAILVEGRRSGALPGWLREGLELEPDEARLRRPVLFDEHEAIEPVEVEDEDGDGGGPGRSR